MISKLIIDVGANLPVDFSIESRVPTLFNMMSYRHNYLGLEHQEYLKTISTNIPVLVTSLVLWWCHFYYDKHVVNVYNQCIMDGLVEDELYTHLPENMVSIPTQLYQLRVAKAGFPVDVIIGTGNEKKILRTTMEHFAPMIRLPMDIPIIAEEVDVEKKYGIEKYKDSNVYLLQDFIMNVILSNHTEYDDFYKEWETVLSKNDACWRAVVDFFFPRTILQKKKGIPPNAVTEMVKYFPEKFDDKTKKVLNDLLGVEVQSDTDETEESEEAPKQKKKKDKITMMEDADKLIAEKEQPEWERSGGKNKKQQSQQASRNIAKNKSPDATPKSKRPKSPSSSSKSVKKGTASAKKSNENESDEGNAASKTKQKEKLASKRKSNDDSDYDEENESSKRFKKGKKKTPKKNRDNDETDTDDEKSDGEMQT